MNTTLQTILGILMLLGLVFGLIFLKYQDFGETAYWMGIGLGILRRIMYA